jgi:hypothetical protein
MLAEQEHTWYAGEFVPDPALAGAILQTLHYADLFDFPMTLDEITRYLIGVRADPTTVGRELARNPTLQAAVGLAEGFYYLAGREGLISVRRARDAVSAALWRRTHRYVRLLQWFPFVRMVAITGALAMDNVGQRVDIDLLIAAAPGRVWICRRFVIMGVRLARLFGDELCPNYIVDTRHLQMGQQDLYTAHELVQMVPLAGYALYRRMLAANHWADAHLPNAGPRPAPQPGRLARLWRGLQALVEAPLSLPLFAAWERAELGRMQQKLIASRSTNPEIVFTAVQCKGHLGAYRATVLDRFAQRVASGDTQRVPGVASGE